MSINREEESGSNQLTPVVADDGYQRAEAAPKKCFCYHLWDKYEHTFLIVYLT